MFNNYWQLAATCLLTTLTVLVSACDPAPAPESTVLTELHEQCFDQGVDCEEKKADVLLYLDTGNLPSHNGDSTYLVLCDHVVEKNQVCEGYRLGFNFTGQLSEEIDPGLEHRGRWLVQIDGAGLEYCDTCYTNDGLDEVISITGTADMIVVMEDPDLEEQIYADLVD